MISHYLSVAVAGPFLSPFTYQSEELVAPGCRVLVPFGKKQLLGISLGESIPPPGMTIKYLTSVLDSGPAINQSLLQFCLWVADYYICNPADPLLMTLPPLLRTARSSNNAPARSRPVTRYHFRGAGAETDRSMTYRGRQLQPFSGNLTRTALQKIGWSAGMLSFALERGIISAQADELVSSIVQKDKPTPALTADQQRVMAQLSDQPHDKFSVSLLHGVTGSGKTLVYCTAAEAALARGKSVLMLTPEIALTGAISTLATSFFGPVVTLLHSQMSDAERQAGWQRIRTGDTRVVVGPRSALFAPLESIGLIIVDEEHDPSYKQDDPSPRFHGRDAAIMRGKLSNCPVLLGSASPSLESYKAAMDGKYRLLELPVRATGAAMPHVERIDLKTSRLAGDLSYLSYPLKKSIEATMQQQEQVILFLNRRGYSRSLSCSACGHVVTCPSCHIPFTYHKRGNKVACHYCGRSEAAPTHCPSCAENSLDRLGTGTQRVEEDIARLFPQATTIRFDADSTRGRSKPESLLAAMESGKGNLLLGTQMVTKGLDLPNVTLVGVLSADQGLDQPDFRASEKTFARLLQVAGRSGRSSKPGRVMLQTWMPEHPVISSAAAGVYRPFFDAELQQRKQFDYPPFCRLVNCLLSGTNETAVEKSALAIRESLHARAASEKISLTLLGPAPCSQYQIGGKFRRHLLVKTSQMIRLIRLLHTWGNESPPFGLKSSVRLVLDVDPVEMG